MNKNDENDAILVSAIVANYNGKDFLKKCFESLYSQKINGKIEIVFVDDNSNDGSYEFVIDNFPGIIAIKNDKNLGHSESCNVGISKSSGKYVFLIDNDTEFADDCISELICTLESDENIACVGGMIKDYGESNLIQDFGMDVDIFGYVHGDIGTISGYFDEDKGQFSVSRECFYLSSCAIMTTRDILDEVGYFDKDYFMYKDDLDLCWRVRLLGYKIVANPNAKIYHKMGVTLGGSSIQQGKRYETSYKKRYYGERNTIMTLLKNYETFTLVLIMPAYMCINLCEMAFFIASAKFFLAKAYYFAWAWNIKNLKSTIHKRKGIMKKRKIGDYSMIRNMHIGSYKLKTLLRMGMPNKV